MNDTRKVQIDSLRGILAMVIVIYHLLCRYKQIYTNDTVWFMENWGTFAVCSFFVISGYFLVPRKMKRPFSIRNYIKRKIVRLWPLYAIALSITSLSLVILKLPNHHVSVRNFLLNLFWLNGFIGTPYIEGAHWYLTALLSVILLFGLLCKMNIDRNPIAYMCVLILDCILVVCKFNTLHILLGGGYFGIAVCGIALRYGEISQRRGRYLWHCVLAVAILYTYKFRGFYSAIGCVLGTILFVIVDKKKIRIMESKLLVELGKRSFALYLIHQNIGYAIQYKLSTVFNGYHWYFSFISMIIVVLLSMWLYELEQKTMMNMKMKETMK